MSFSIQDFAVKSSPLTIAVGADHGGFEAKKALLAKLNENGITVWPSEAGSSWMDTQS